MSQVPHAEVVVDDAMALLDRRPAGGLGQVALGRPAGRGRGRPRAAEKTRGGEVVEGWRGSSLLNSKSKPWWVLTPGRQPFQRAGFHASTGSRPWLSTTPKCPQRSQNARGLDLERPALRFFRLRSVSPARTSTLRLCGIGPNARRNGPGPRLAASRLVFRGTSECPLRQTNPSCSTHHD